MKSLMFYSLIETGKSMIVMFLVLYILESPPAGSSALLSAGWPFWRPGCPSLLRQRGNRESPNPNATKEKVWQLCRYKESNY